MAVVDESSQIDEKAPDSLGSGVEPRERGSLLAVVPIALLAICLLALGVRIYKLTEHSLWIDELLTVIRARKYGFAALAKRQECVTYVLHHFFYLILPHSDFFFRLPSVLTGAGGVIFAYLIARECFGKTEGLAAAFLLALAPYHIHHSQEMRYYAHLAFFTLGGAWCLMRATGGGRRWPWLGFGAFGLLNVFTHQVGLFVVGLECAVGGVLVLFVACRPGDSDKRHVIVRYLRASIPLAACAFVVFGIYLLRHYERIPGLLGIVGGSAEGRYLHKAPLQIDRMKLILNMYNRLDGTAIPWITLGFLLVGVAGSFRRYGRGLVVCLPFVLAGFGVLGLAQFRKVPYERYFIWMLPFFLILVSRGLVLVSSIVVSVVFRIARRSGKDMSRRAGEGLVLSVVLCGVYAGGAIPVLAKEYAKERGVEWRMAARLIKDQALPGEIVLMEGKPILREQIRFGLRHYFRYGETRMSDPPKLVDFPGIAKLEEMDTETSTAWRVLRMRRVWGVTPTIAQGAGTFPGIHVRRFFLDRPIPVDLPNGSFEIDSGIPSEMGQPSPGSRRYDVIANNDFPDGWFASRQGKVTVGLDTQVRSHGHQSLSIKFEQAGSYCHLISAPIPADARYIYEASARVRVAGKASVAVFALPLDRNLKPVKHYYLQRTGEQDGWQLYRLTDRSGYSEFSVTPDGTVALCMMVQVEKRTQPGTTVWFDDLRVSAAWPREATTERLHRLVRDRVASGNRPKQ